MHETLVRFLRQEDALEKEMATHPISFPGKSHVQRSLGSQRVRHDLMTKPPPPKCI